MVSMGNTVVDMCSQLRDHEINTAIDKEKATDDSDESKQKRKEIKTRGGRALIVGRLAESFDMLGLDIVKKGTGGVVVSLVDEIEETTDDAAWLRVKTGSKKSKVVAKGGYAGVKKPMVYSADVWTKKKNGSEQPAKSYADQWAKKNGSEQQPKSYADVWTKENGPEQPMTSYADACAKHGSEQPTTSYAYVCVKENGTGQPTPLYAFQPKPSHASAWATNEKGGYQHCRYLGKPKPSSSVDYSGCGMD